MTLRQRACRAVDRLCTQAVDQPMTSIFLASLYKRGKTKEVVRLGLDSSKPDELAIAF